MLPENPPNPDLDDREEPVQPPGTEPAASTPLFSGICMRGPVEELERVYQNRSRGLESSGGQDQLDRLSRGYEIARDRLSIALGLSAEPEQDEAQQDDGGEGLYG